MCEGEFVDAVVPFMGESVSDGTLANFLKSKFFGFGPIYSIGAKLASSSTFVLNMLMILCLQIQVTG